MRGRVLRKVLRQGDISEEGCMTGGRLWGHPSSLVSHEITAFQVIFSLPLPLSVSLSLSLSLVISLSLSLSLSLSACLPAFFAPPQPPPLCCRNPTREFARVLKLCPFLCLPLPLLASLWCRTRITLTTKEVLCTWDQRYGLCMRSSRRFFRGHHHILHFQVTACLG